MNVRATGAMMKSREEARTHSAASSGAAMPTERQERKEEKGNEAQADSVKKSMLNLANGDASAHC